MKKSNTNHNTHIVQDMIEHLQILYCNNDPILNSVADVNLLYDSLHDLNEIVGMYDIKDSIIKLIKFLMIEVGSDKKEHKFDQHMLHSVIFGPPGVGKTSIGCVLSKIWLALGLVSKKKIKPQRKTLLDESITTDDIPDNIRNKFVLFPVPIYLHDKNIEYSYTKQKDSKPPNKDNPINKDTKTQNPNPKNETLSTINTNIPNIPNIPKHNIPVQRPNIYGQQPLITNKKITRNQSEPNIRNFYFPQNMHIPNPKLPNPKQKTIPKAILNYPELKQNQIDDNIKNIIEDIIIKQRETRCHELVKNLLSSIINSKKHDENNGNNENITKQQLKRTHTTPPIKIVSRPDMVAQYIGHSCAKCQKLFTETMEEGKVLFIDEAYGLVLDERDSFGHEALNELNRFMSEYPELIVILAGYKDKMEQHLFRFQPGLQRRISWMFEIFDYTPEMMASIFKKQLANNLWTYEGSDKHLTNFFKDKQKYFPNFGGDTLRLVLYCKLKFCELKFDFNLNQNLKNKTINLNILQSAYDDMYVPNRPPEDDVLSKTMMYI